MHTRFIDRFDVVLLDVSHTFMFDVDRSKIVFVGDSLKRDIAGAKAVGLSSVWINAGINRIDQSIPGPELIIKDLQDLIER